MGGAHPRQRLLNRMIFLPWQWKSSSSIRIHSSFFIAQLITRKNDSLCLRLRINAKTQIIRVRVCPRSRSSAHAYLHRVMRARLRFEFQAGRALCISPGAYEPPEGRKERPTAWNGIWFWTLLTLPLYGPNLKWRVSVVFIANAQRCTSPFYAIPYVHVRTRTALAILIVTRFTGWSKTVRSKGFESGKPRRHIAL